MSHWLTHFTALAGVSTACELVTTVCCVVLHVKEASTDLLGASNNQPGCSTHGVCHSVCVCVCTSLGP